MHLNLDVGYFFVSKRYRKFFQVMRLLILMLTLTFMHASAATYSQTVTLSAKNVSIEKVLNEVEKQTGYNLFYKYSEKVMSKAIDVDFKKTALKSVLNTVLVKNGLAYKLDKNTIVITYVNSSNAGVNEIEVVQNSTLTGTVVDKANNLPLIGASVKLKGTTTGVVTNAKGVFSLGGIKSGDILQVFYIGYKLQEITVGSARTLTIALDEDLANLDGIIVTGYATQKKREITGSISSIKASDIGGAQAVSLDQAMQGRMAGVNIQGRVGVPGAALKVEIRGPGSISAGTDPIYIVDGLILNNSGVSNNISTNPLSVVNPDDIESIEVLKDAAAASVYGAQAGNGVVLITTKKGKAGKVTVDASYRGGSVELIRFLELTNTQQYLSGRLDAIRNSNPTFSEAQAWTKLLTDEKLPTTLTEADVAALPSYDWQRAAYRGGKTGKYDFAISGGANNSSYRISASLEDSEGAVVGTDFFRGTVNFNYNNKITEKLELTTAFNLSSVEQNGPQGALGSTTEFSAPSYSAPMILPFHPIYNADGSYNAPVGGFSGALARHPLHETELNEFTEKNKSLVGNLQLKYNILANLSFKTLVGLDYRDLASRRYLDPRTELGRSSGGTLTEIANKPTTFTTSGVLQYAPNLGGKHQLNTLAGLEYRAYQNTTSSITGRSFANYLFRQMSSAAVITNATGAWTGVKRVGSFLQGNYVYDGKYMVSAILRYDGSSRFGNDSKFGLFPSLSVGWDIAKENFITNKSLINQLKLRFGYGETGNDQIGNFDSRSLYGGGVTYDSQPGIRPSSIGNANLRWERNVTYNLGLDYSVLNNRLFGSVEVYSRYSKDLLLNKPVSWIGGFNDITENLGEVLNKGVEAEVGANIINNGKFKWTSNFNIAFLKNEVISLYDDLQSLPGDNSIRVGYSMRTYLLPQYAGVNAATGKPMWYDKNGDYTYNPATVVDTDFYAPYGFPNELPKFYGGFNNNFSYKGFSLGVFFQYDYGRVMHDMFTRNISRKGDTQTNGMLWFHENRWTTPGQITAVPRSIIGKGEINNALADVSSTRFLQDASYIRLKNVNLSYSFPKEIISKIKLSNLKLYAQANNIFTITKFQGYDPEFYNTTGTAGNNGLIPAVKSYYFGIQLTY